MDQLIELLQQIQDLSGVAIDALKGAGEHKPEGGGEGKPAEGAPAGGGEPPAEAKAEGDKPRY